MSKQIKSKRRVSDFGEVYTNEREVNAMLDLVKYEANRIESRFLEPAAGNGNFLIKILQRKLKVVHKRYKKNQLEYERYSFLAVSSIYGIDILEDNVKECRLRLFTYLKEQYDSLYKESCSQEFLESIKYLLEKNIICGDTLTGLKIGNPPEPIIFSEWTMINHYVKRKDFAMCDLLAYQDLLTNKNKTVIPRHEFKLIPFKEVSRLG
ncbi:SAM-dependent DNA methyltransferase [Turicibacter sanguinis]|uniref:SAM-dependent DNA methyltransferase n=1 Tax=Turicibacter sanguinis TaxID=154288 RepID=UPI00189DC826|nr:SAM-dependent DNA methyltransferase [Turicibacter sanguinis]